ncbi:PLP-dependent transferase [Xylariaceae sp. FL0016]|nr:PLP-dependent transferase [Xylariaceae sp. FL0016]
MLAETHILHPEGLPLRAMSGTAWTSLSTDNAQPCGANNRPLVVRGRGNYLQLDDGREILDACGGAAVACLGHGVQDVIDAMTSQALKVSYVPWGFFDSVSRQTLSQWLSRSSDGHFMKAYINCSGSEAMEGAMKLAHEYFLWKGEPQRVNFIAREESYHGITLGALALGGHLVRRGPFEPLLTGNVHRIPACNPFRQRRPRETDTDFVVRKAAELEAAFLEIGPGSVVAFVAEPIVGAASGCIPPVPGYFRAMKSVCDKYGALLIFDEVMCGMGRTGTIHAWQQEGIAPDIQAVGKGLAGGYQPVSAILASEKIVNAMEAKKATFTHGHTYQDHATGCAAALKVQQIVHDQDLLANVKTQGRYLAALLREKLQTHPHVGDIRGRGLFWGIEFVRNKETKQPFDPRLQVAHRVHTTALNAPYNMAIYHGQGCAGNKRGDHIMIMPAYNVTGDVIESIADKVSLVVHEVFVALAKEVKL